MRKRNDTVTIGISVYGKDISLNKIVEASKKRRCPYCSSDKWKWLGALPVSLEMLKKQLVVKYRCEKCNKEFLANEAKGIKLVDNADKCIYCTSRNIEKISKEGADLELFRCKQCNGFMGLKN